MSRDSGDPSDARSSAVRPGASVRDHVGEIGEPVRPQSGAEDHPVAVALVQGKDPLRARDKCCGEAVIRVPGLSARGWLKHAQ